MDWEARQDDDTGTDDSGNDVDIHPQDNDALAINVGEAELALDISLDETSDSPPIGVDEADDDTDISTDESDAAVDFDSDEANALEEKVKSIQPEQLSFWQMVRRFFSQTPGEKAAEQRRRMTDLNHAIADAPEVAGNYLLRGEVRFEMRQYELARDDFMQAIELAEAQFDSDRWGLAAQSIIDRAREGLRQVRRYLD